MSGGGYWAGDVAGASGDSKFDRVTLYTVPQEKRFVASFGSVSGQGGPTGFTTADSRTVMGQGQKTNGRQVRLGESLGGAP